MRLKSNRSSRIPQASRGHLPIRKIFALSLTVALVAVTDVGLAEERSAENLEQGKTLFQEFCLVCHGARGQGTTLGPSIISGAVSGDSDSDLARVIAQGRAANGMPMFGRSMDRQEIDSIVAFIRTLQDKSAEKREARSEEAPPVDLSGGDIRKGQALFRGKANCASCHTTYFVGGSIGPDLSEVARHRSQADIYEAVTNPSGKVLRAYRAKKLSLKDGDTVVGRYRNETAESIQILNDRGDLWTTYLTADIESDETLRKESLMPSDLLSSLDEQETKDLFAYLFSLN